MNTIEQFKNDLWNGIWQHAKNLFKPMSIVALISFIFSMAFTFFVLARIMGTDGFQQMTDPAAMFDFEAMAERNLAMAEYFENFGIGKMMALSFIAFIVSMIVVSWVTNFLLILSEQQISQSTFNIGTAFSQAFNGDVFKIFGLMLIVMFAYVGLIVVSVMLGGLHPILAFIALPFVVAFLCRFVAGFPAIVHGKMSLSDALSFSMKNITWGRGFKIMLVMIVFSIVYFLALLLLSSIFGFIGTPGSVLMMVVQIGLSILTYSLYVSAISATFYRYVEVEYEDEENADQHIIDTV